MYKLLSSTAVLRLDDGACIPFDEGNRDYEEYLVWVAEGNSAQPADPPPAPPPIDMQVLAVAAPNLSKTLAALKLMSPEDVAAWVDTNVLDLPSAINAIKLLAVALCITRRQIRGESQ